MKTERKIFLLTALAGSLLLLVASTLVSVPRSVYAASPTVSVSPKMGGANSTTVISGVNFQPNEIVDITWACNTRGCSNGLSAGSATTDGSGSFSKLLTVSPNFAGGLIDIGVEGEPHGPTDDFADAWFYASGVEISVSPTSGASGSTATVNGQDFGISQHVTVKWNCTGIDCSSPYTLASFTMPSNSNSFSVPVTIPAGFGAGSYRIGAIDDSIQQYSSTVYQIVPATLSASPTRSPGGSAASVSGTGFQANESVTLKWNCSRIDCTSHYTLLPNGERSFQGVRVLGTATADSSGNFTKSFTVPPFSPGSYPIGAVGGTSNTFATTPFTVAQPATVTLSPNAGHAGSGYSASGTGFRSGETVTVKFNCASQSCSSLQTLGTATAQPDGSFSIASVTIPNFSARSYPVAAIGGTSNTLATTTFTVN